MLHATFQKCCRLNYTTLPGSAKMAEQLGNKRATRRLNPISLPLKRASWEPEIPVSLLGSCLMWSQLLMADEWQSIHQAWKLCLSHGRSNSYDTGNLPFVMLSVQSWPLWLRHQLLNAVLHPPYRFSCLSAIIQLFSTSLCAAYVCYMLIWDITQSL